MDTSAPARGKRNDGVENVINMLNCLGHFPFIPPPPSPDGICMYVNMPVCLAVWLSFSGRDTWNMQL